MMSSKLNLSLSTVIRSPVNSGHFLPLSSGCALINTPFKLKCSISTMEQSTSCSSTRSSILSRPAPEVIDVWSDEEEEEEEEENGCKVWQNCSGILASTR